MQPDCGGDLDVLFEVGLQRFPHVHEELEIGLAGACGPVAVELHLVDSDVVFLAHRVNSVRQMVGERRVFHDGLRRDEDHGHDVEIAEGLIPWERDGGHGHAFVLLVPARAWLHVEEADVHCLDVVVGEELPFVIVGAVPSAPEIDGIFAAVQCVVGIFVPTAGQHDQQHGGKDKGLCDTVHNGAV